MSEPLLGRYDVVWYSNVLHIRSPEENQARLKRIRSALSPREKPIIQDSFLRCPQGLYPEEASFFSVNMLVFKEE